jgi:hypothetical protein
MIFEPESVSATAVKPSVAVLVEDAAEALLLDFRRVCAHGALPDELRVERFDNPDALW